MDAFVVHYGAVMSKNMVINTYYDEWFHIMAVLSQNRDIAPHHTHIHWSYANPWATIINY